VVRDVAAFIVEPIQGKGVQSPGRPYLRGAQALSVNMEPYSSPTKIQTEWGARTLSRGRTLGSRADYVLLAQDASGGHYGRRGFDAQGNL